jgi:hypothetical protein
MLRICNDALAKECIVCERYVCFCGNFYLLSLKRAFDTRQTVSGTRHAEKISRSIHEHDA